MLGSRSWLLASTTDRAVRALGASRHHFGRFVELRDFFSLGARFVRGGRGCFCAMWVDRLFVAT